MIINNQEWTPIVVLGEIFAVQNKSGNSIRVVKSILCIQRSVLCIK